MVRHIYITLQENLEAKKHWWLTPFFTINASYKYIWNEKDGVKGESSGLLGRLILVLE